MVKEEQQKTVRIRCTPENVQDMRAAVRRWPDLQALVQGLQRHGLFPGLRGLEITLTGSAEHVAKGLGAIDFENAPEGRKFAQGGGHAQS